MKFILILFLTIWLAACSSTEKSEVIPDRFNNFMRLILTDMIMNMRILVFVVIEIMVDNQLYLQLKRLI